MTVITQDVYIFHEAETVEKALEKMRRAIGKKQESAAAVKFAHTMLELWGERKTIENTAERRRLDLLFTFNKIHAVKNRVHDVIKYASALAQEVYSEYTALGGDRWEEKAYRTGKTKKEVIDEAFSEEPPVLLDVRTVQTEETAPEDP
jgi:hypothetical protein